MTDTGIYGKLYEDWVKDLAAYMKAYPCLHTVEIYEGGNAPPGTKDYNVLDPTTGLTYQNETQKRFITDMTLFNRYGIPVSSMKLYQLPVTSPKRAYKFIP